MFILPHYQGTFRKLKGSILPILWVALVMCKRDYEDSPLFNPENDFIRELVYPSTSEFVVNTRKPFRRLDNVVQYRCKTNPKLIKSLFTSFLIPTQ